MAVPGWGEEKGWNDDAGRIASGRGGGKRKRKRGGERVRKGKETCGEGGGKGILAP